jgi:glycosyltransferase involved in cell wall biosynthesis
MSKISLIIPVYNVEGYLKRCLDSVFEQSVPMEVIVIDDGSTDQSPLIIESYRHHENLIIIKQVNGGISAARNAGLKVASGEYIFFLDSDDMLLPDAMTQIMPFLSGADIVLARAVKCFEDGFSQMIEHPLSTSVSGKEYLRQGLPAKFPVMVWLNGYRKAFLDEHQLRFLPQTVHEDEDFIIRALLKAQLVIAAPITLLNYMIRPQSFTTSARKRKSGVDLCKIAFDIIALSEQVDDLLKVGLRMHAVKLYIKAFRHAGVQFDNPFATFSRRFSVLLLPMSVSDRLKMLFIVFFPLSYRLLFSLKHDRRAV